MARETGKVYKHYYNTPLSKGILQFDLWGIKDKSSCGHLNTLKKLLKRYGARNSLLTACMPTASTAQILGNNEFIEPITSNLYVRRTNAGDFHATMSSICLILSKLLGLRLRSLASRLILSSFVSAMESFSSKVAKSDSTDKDIVVFSYLIEDIYYSKNRPQGFYWFDPSKQSIMNIQIVTLHIIDNEHSNWNLSIFLPCPFLYRFRAQNKL